MSTMVKAKLGDGAIYGDTSTGEYVYMPASEIGLAAPLCVLETPDGRRDIPLLEAVYLVRKLSLKPVRHPQWGLRSC